MAKLKKITTSLSDKLSETEKLLKAKEAQLNETKVESREEVKSGKPPIDLKKLNAEIARLERQKDQLLTTVKLRQEIARVQMELAIHEAKMREQELDDETALIMLL